MNHLLGNRAEVTEVFREISGNFEIYISPPLGLAAQHGRECTHCIVRCS